MTQQPHGSKSQAQQKAEGFLDTAFKAFGKAREKVGELAHDNREKIDSAIDKIGTVVNDRTGGKYADKVATVKGHAAKGVDLVEGDKKTDPATTGPGMGDSVWSDPTLRPEAGVPPVSQPYTQGPIDPPINDQPMNDQGPRPGGL